MSNPVETWALSRRYGLLGLLALVVLLAGVGHWAVTAQLGGAIVVSGTVEAARNRQVVQHAAGGVVKDVLVREGDQVEGGALLLRLDTTQARRELLFARAALLDLEARTARLLAVSADHPDLIFPDHLRRAAANDPVVAGMLADQRQVFVATRRAARLAEARMTQKQSELRAEISGLQAQMGSLTQQMDLLLIDLSAQRQLQARGLVPKVAVLALEREAAALEGQRAGLQARRAVLQERLTNIELEHEANSAAARSTALADAQDLAQPIREMRLRIARLEAEIESAEIRAPAPGIVHQMTAVAPRAVLQPAAPILHLIPQDRPRIILAQLNPRHIDEVHAGQSVVLRLTAFDMRSTPELSGTVRQVSADAIVDERSGTRHFQLEIALNPGEAERLPDGLRILPGMPVEAFVQTGSRTPLAYLIKPLSDYFAHALRES